MKVNFDSAIEVPNLKLEFAIRFRIRSSNTKFEQKSEPHIKYNSNLYFEVEIQIENISNVYLNR